MLATHWLHKVAFCLGLTLGLSTLVDPVWGQGLIARYFLDNASAVDASGKSNNGRVIGGVSPTPDRFGNPCGAALFDGFSGYIEVPTSHSLESPKIGFTAMAWVKIADKPTKSFRELTIVCKGDQAPETVEMPQYRFQVFQFSGVNTSTVSLNTATTGTDADYANHLFPVDTWFPVALVYDGAEIRYYQNGEMVYRFAYSVPLFSNKAPLHIGKDIPGTTEMFSGAMDDVNIYDRALSEAEIQALINAPKPPTRPGNAMLPAMANIKLTAQPTTQKAQVNWQPPSFTQDPCSEIALVQLAGPAPGSWLDPGEYNVVYGLKSGVSLSALTAFTIYVVAPPIPIILQCPRDTIVKASSITGKKVTYPAPIVLQPSLGVSVLRTSGAESGALFAPGTNPVSFSAKDAKGQTAQCSFTVRVLYTPPPEEVPQPTPTPDKESEKPPQPPPIEEKAPPPPKPDLRLECPREISKNTTDTAGIRIKYPEARIITPNGGQVRRQDGIESGGTFPIGTTTVHYIATDSYGNIATCAFQVKVTYTPPSTSPKPKTSDTTKPKSPDPLPPPAPPGNDKVVVQHQVTTKERILSVLTYDNDKDDGDRISIYLNGDLIQENKRLHTQKSLLGTKANKIDAVVTLKPGYNYLVVKAMDEGRRPTVTCTMSLYKGQVDPNDLGKLGSLGTYLITGKKGLAAAIQIYVSP